ncbi:MAG: hypothetical protein LBF74_12450 [Treponema sp.]|jgi:hypothetical protein|nr:hypothetical protein [Treponema sp.]
MPVEESYTVTELMKKSKKSRGAVESFISRHGIKPLSYEAIYPSDILELLFASKRGRSAKKPKTPEQAEAPKRRLRFPPGGEKKPTPPLPGIL